MTDLAVEKSRPRSGERSPGGFRTDIQGLRAVAVGLVLAFHAGLPFVPGGYVGVDVFFVLSGFLITGLIVREVERTGVRLTTIVLGVAFAATMGLSRVFLGHHWLSDVLMGWVLGLAWATVVVTAHRLFLTVRREAARRGAPPTP